MNKAVFLDRDGTINVDYGYVSKIKDFKFLPGVIEGLKLLQANGFLLIVITNQSGIARGMYSKNDFLALHKWINQSLEKHFISIDGLYFCPHLNEQCSCRKPNTGLFYEAQKDFDIDFSASFAIGDNLRDLSICDKEAVTGILVNSSKEKTKYVHYDNFLAASEFMVLKK